MKSILTISVSLMTIMLLYSFTTNKNKEYSLTIKVEDLRNSIGEVQFALYNTEGSIPDEHYKSYFKLEKANITDNKSEITFTNLPKGKYAVNILHDENKNGKIDKNFILPKEGIGFSNFQSIRITNRPNFSKASFDLKENKTISVKIIYL